MDNQQYNAKRKQYSLFCTFIMLLPIIHAIGQILVQSFMNFSEETNLFSGTFGLGFIFGSSLVSMSIMSFFSLPIDALNSVSSVITIALTLAYIFMASFMIKGDKKIPLIVLGIYTLDTIFSLTSVFCTFSSQCTLHLTPLVIVFQIVLHLLFLFVAIYAYLLRRKLNQFENAE